MKPIRLFVCSLLFPLLVSAQSVPYQVVFDLTSRDTNDHKTVMRWLSAISAENPDAMLEVVLYGQSLPMVEKSKSVVASTVHKLTEGNKSIRIKVCAASMKRHNVTASELLPGVAIVPDGIYEIITRQKQGWGYIKVAH